MPKVRSLFLLLNVSGGITFENGLIQINVGLATYKEAVKFLNLAKLASENNIYSFTRLYVSFFFLFGFMFLKAYNFFCFL